MKKRGAPPTTQLKLGVNGDRRTAESVVLDVRAAAQRLGLEIESIVVRAAPGNGRKPAAPRKASLRRKPRSRS